MQKQIHKYPQKRIRRYSPYRDGKPLSMRDIHASWVGGGSARLGTKTFCITCREAHKRYWELDTCPVCGAEVVAIAQRARLPRKTASNKEWDKFVDLFVKVYKKKER